MLLVSQLAPPHPAAAVGPPAADSGRDLCPCANAPPLLPSPPLMPHLLAGCGLLNRHLRAPAALPQPPEEYGAVAAAAAGGGVLRQWLCCACSRA